MARDWIASERRELAAMLDGLSAGQWDAPSLCDGWAIRHVVAHLTMPFRYSKAKFMFELVKAGGKFSSLSDSVARRDAKLPTAQLPQIPTEPMRAVLDTVSGPKPRRFFGVDVAGTELRATDLDWSFGSGPPLLGRAQDLVLLLTGRRVPEGALSGEGVGLRAASAGR